MRLTHLLSGSLRYASPIATTKAAHLATDFEGVLLELNTLLFANLYCRQEGIEFALASGRWNSAYQLGWNDFEPSAPR